MSNITSVSAEFGGQTLTIETGRMARLAGGAVTVRYGDTVVLGTAKGEPLRTQRSLLASPTDRFAHSSQRGIRMTFR
jgi:polyribonucleotide nucleotidyltransferase